MKCFFKKRKKSHTLLNYLHQVLKCWISDDYYDVFTLETIFKECFNETQRMFNTFSSVSEMKVGVTVTTISDASFFVFFNYNELSVRNKESDEIETFLSWILHLTHCRIQAFKTFKCSEWVICMRSMSLNVRSTFWIKNWFITEAELLLQHLCQLFIDLSSQLFTANTEPCSLVKPVYISAIETFQNGGLKHNNSVNLTLWECHQIWSSVDKPDLMMSLGTETDTISKLLSASNFWHLFKNDFIPQLYRSFMSSLNDQSAWREFVNELNERSWENYF